MESIFCPVCNQEHNASIEEPYCHNCKHKFLCDGIDLVIDYKTEIDITREIIDDRSIHPGDCDACYIHTAIMQATKYSRSDIDVDYDGIGISGDARVEYFKCSPGLHRWQFQAVENYREYCEDETPEITIVFDETDSNFMVAHIKGEEFSIFYTE